MYQPAILISSTHYFDASDFLQCLLSHLSVGVLVLLPIWACFAHLIAGVPANFPENSRNPQVNEVVTLQRRLSDTDSSVFGVALVGRDGKFVGWVRERREKEALEVLRLHEKAQYLVVEAEATITVANALATEGSIVMLSFD